MTTNDKKLIAEARKSLCSDILDMIGKADTEEARNELDGLALRAYRREERVAGIY